MNTQKIVLVGPESTGKTTLGQELAHYFDGIFVAEFGRKYLEDGNTVKNPSDLLHIAKEQLSHVQEAIRNSKGTFLFADTDLHNIVVWSQFELGECHPDLLALEQAQEFDFYLLLRPDIPWEQDGVRKNLISRDVLYSIYKRHLIDQNRCFAEISGKGSARFQACLNALATAPSVSAISSGV